jgi:tetratricopeptide (TPR) repeat protein
MVALCAASVAHAEDDPVNRARLNFEAGMRLYQAERYEDALKSFETGYRLAARPAFLINIGQCLRMLSRPREARAAFARFLVDAPTRDPHRKGVESMVAELDQEIALLPPEPPPPAVLQPSPAASPAPLVVAPPPPPPRQKANGIRKFWWLIPLSVVAAAGVAVGLGVGLTSRSCPPGDLCVVADGPR